MKKTVIKILIVVFALCFCVSAFFLVRYYVNSKAQSQVYEDLSQMMQTGEAETEESQYTLVTDPQGNQMQILRQFAALYAENPDVIGWMRIEGTALDYPVMYKPEKKDYYLRKNFYGEKATHGCLYIQENCSVLPQSDNLTIYGHNMRDGSMFACLKNYRMGSFWQTHPVITFNTLTEEAQYEIFAVFTTTSTVGEGFKYHNFIDAGNEQEFMEFVNTCKTLSFYDTGVEPVMGDQFITLSTCEKSFENGRFVVVARKIV